MCQNQPFLKLLLIVVLIPATEEQTIHPQAGVSCVVGGFSSRESGKDPHEAMRYNSVVSEPEVGENPVRQRAEY